MGNRPDRPSEDTPFMKMLILPVLMVIGSHVCGDDQTLHWSFTDKIVNGTIVGDASINPDGLEAPVYPGFPSGNTVLKLNAPSWIRIADTAEAAKFDFDNGDAVTFEAWVRINSMGENVYLISKGRTGTSGPKANNQNWAFRLRSNKGQACVNFLFRSRKTANHPGDWHRWTSDTGITAGSRWHHVAVSYRFGDPKSIRGFVDGKQVKGSWDMGGETTQPPVVDDDEVWIGSTMGGLRNNSLDGAIDDLMIHRKEVPTAELLARYQWNPPPIAAPAIPDGKVAVQLFGPFDSNAQLPEHTEAPLLQWTQDELGFVSLPQKYDAWAIREDWGKTVLVRAWADVRLPKGLHRILLRSRGLATLKIDDEEILRTSLQKKYGGAHGVVKDLPEVPAPGMRPHALNESEGVAEFKSDGQTHRIRLDVIVGGPSYRMEFGECCVAIAEPLGMFHILSESTRFPLTDDGWKQFASKHSRAIHELDRARRSANIATTTAYWNERHDYAVGNLVINKESQNIDRLIKDRIDAHNQNAGIRNTTNNAGAAFYREHIQPIFDAHCIRCHAEKQQGGLRISDRTSMLTGGESGEPAVVPHKPDASYLFQLVSAPSDDYRMPPKGAGLSTKEIDLVRKWIGDGAAMPAAPKSVIKTPQKADDFTFLRRVFLDTVGLPPTTSEAAQFFADAAATRRTAVIDRLLEDERWAGNWVGYWQDVLAENPNLLKPTLNNTGPFRYWIHEALIDNKPIDRFATELILMRGSTWGGGTAGFAIASQNDVPMAAKAHVIGSAFLGIDMKCARCHDAPYHQWKQSDLFQMAAMLDRKQLTLPESSTVPAAFFEKQERKSLIEVSLKPGSSIANHFPFVELTSDLPDSLLLKPGDTREELALRVTASRRFAEVMANRIWKRLMGIGLVEPVDDWEGNPASDPKLLSALADELILNNYDIKRFVRTILLSETYQREAVDLPARHSRFFAGPYRKRMTAEQVVDSAFQAVGKAIQTEKLTMDVEGVQPASRFLNFGFPERAWEFTTLANERDRPSLALPKVQAVIDVLKAFGWRNSRPEPATEREEAPNLIQPGVLANGTLGIWLTRLTDDSRLTAMMMEDLTVEQLTEKLFMQLLTRRPTESERQDFLALLAPGFEERVVPESDWGTPHEPRRFRYVSWSNHLNSEANVIKMQMQELVRKGPPPTRFLKTEWRERAEDAVWSLLNSPEMILVP